MAMFIQIGKKGVLINALLINSITPFEETIEEKNGDITHYGVKLAGNIEPEHTNFFFGSEGERNDFMDSVLGSNMIVKLDGSAAATATTERPETKKGKAKNQ